MEGIESALLVGIKGPCFTAIVQCTEHAGLVQLHLGVNGQYGTAEICLEWELKDKS